MEYHEGERAVQSSRGAVAEADRLQGIVRPGVPAVAAPFLRERAMVLIAAEGTDGLLWVTPLCGAPGFVDVPDERLVVISAVLAPDDPLAGAFDTTAEFGLVALDLLRRRRMRVNGRATRDGDRLLLHTEQVYPNCPKYIHSREITGALPGVVGRAVTGTRLTPEQRLLIERADTFFIGSRVSGVGADCSHRGGNPGFVTVTGPTGLSFPDYPGNSMYQTLGNLYLQEAGALLFVDWRTGDCLQLSGNCAVRDGGRVDFAVTRVVFTPRRVPWSWRLLRYSPTIPTVAAKAVE